jgi:fructan beta-fructosidase
MNDPNGLVYYGGTYHLFFQYYPYSTVWGPMHWGHAASRDLMHWKEYPIALYPDSLGYIFSGSAVLDQNNSSGFGTRGVLPLIAMFTQHDPAGENKRVNYENQSLAYSLDSGLTWQKYRGNPVLKNPGITDFRDPKLIWFAPGHKWILALAARDRVIFYSSQDLRHWKNESEFGKDQGAHGGVWECPDLFRLKQGNSSKWVLLVSVNPGGPNGGSGTQYFLGSFDGTRFVTSDKNIRWLDYGPDDYAGVTWSNTGDRRIFIGWMSNWQYANLIPEGSWRNAMTIPRNLVLDQIGGTHWIRSEPVPELWALAKKTIVEEDIRPGEFRLPAGPGKEFQLPCIVQLYFDTLSDMSVEIGSRMGHKIVIGYSTKGKNFYVDRSQSGATHFSEVFARKSIAPRLSKEPQESITLILDFSSVELFADHGLTAMTSLFFPDQVPDQFLLFSTMPLRKLQLTLLNSVWTKAGN